MSGRLRLSPHYKKLLKFQGQEELALECSELVIQDNEDGIEDVRKICELLDLSFLQRIEGTQKSAVVKLKKEKDGAQDEDADRDPDTPAPPAPPTRLEAHILRTAPRGFAAFYAVLVEAFPSKRRNLSDLLQRHMGTAEDFEESSGSSLSDVSTDESDDSDAEGKEPKEGQVNGKSEEKDDKGATIDVPDEDSDARKDSAATKEDPSIEETKAKEGEEAEADKAVEIGGEDQETASHEKKEEQPDAQSAPGQKRERPEDDKAEAPNGKCPRVEPEEPEDPAKTLGSFLSGLGEDDVDDDE